MTIKLPIWRGSIQTFSHPSHHPQRNETWFQMKEQIVPWWPHDIVVGRCWMVSGWLMYAAQIRWHSRGKPFWKYVHIVKAISRQCFSFTVNQPPKHHNKIRILLRCFGVVLNDGRQQLCILIIHRLISWCGTCSANGKSFIMSIKNLYEAPWPKLSPAYFSLIPIPSQEVLGPIAEGGIKITIITRWNVDTLPEISPLVGLTFCVVKS